MTSSVALLLLLSTAAAAEAPPPTPRARALALVARMNLTEKIAMLHGSSGPYVGNVPGNARLGIPALNLNDGPQGFRDNAHLGTTTSWPSSLTVAASFDVAMAGLWGAGMGKEFFDKGANVQLGPALCVARIPVNGRNFEYLSGEDPFLGYTMVQPVIRGIQGNGVVANAKHWVNNNQETNRQSVSENVDERTRFELYYPPFKGAIEAGVGSVMCSYNKINHVWSCENNSTLGTDLKERLGFQGWVMSDWGATHSTSLLDGLDQEMPGSGWMNEAKLSGMPVARLDDAVVRILTPVIAVGAFDHPSTGALADNVTSAAHTALAQTLSAASTVLLKNDGDLLPLSAAKAGAGDAARAAGAGGGPPKAVYHIAVIGPQAVVPVVHGGGSGQVVPAWVKPYLWSVCDRAGVPRVSPVERKTACTGDAASAFQVGVDFFQPVAGNPSAPGAGAGDCCAQCAARGAACNFFTFQASKKLCWFKETAAGARKDADCTSGACRSGPVGQPTPPSCSADGTVCVSYADGLSNATAAALLAARSDATLVFVATTSSEGSDRGSLALGNGQDALIAAVAKAAPKNAVAVVASVPGAILTPWAASVGAIVTNFMPGQAAGDAVASVLFGDVNPSARLPLTFPNAENEQNMSAAQYPGLDKGENATYSEGLLVGYRWYDHHGVAPAFPFGHGLSYSTFGYSGLRVASECGPAGCGATVAFSVANTGEVDGKEVAQLYLGFPAAAGEPPQLLKGFSVVGPLAPGEARTVTLTLSPRDLSIWDATTHAWALQAGDFGIFVGSSSRDIRLRGVLKA